MKLADHRVEDGDEEERQEIAGDEHPSEEEPSLEGILLLVDVAEETRHALEVEGPEAVKDRPGGLDETGEEPDESDGDGGHSRGYYRLGGVEDHAVPAHARKFIQDIRPKSGVYMLTPYPLSVVI